MSHHAPNLAPRVRATSDNWNDVRKMLLKNVQLIDYNVIMPKIWVKVKITFFPIDLK